MENLLEHHFYILFAYGITLLMLLAVLLVYTIPYVRVKNQHKHINHLPEQDEQSQ